MCRNIKTLFNYDPPATDDEIAASSLQFVRKLSGFTKPSQVNAAVFDQAVEDIARIARGLVDELTTNAEPKNREVEAAKARAVSSEIWQYSNECLMHGPLKIEANDQVAHAEKICRLRGTARSPFTRQIR